MWSRPPVGDNLHNLSRLVNNERCPAGDAALRYQYAISFRCVFIGEVGKQRKLERQIVREALQRRRCIDADPEHLRIRFVKVFDSSLESFHFRGSATGKRKREEGQNNCFAPLEIRQRIRLAGNRGT